MTDIDDNEISFDPNRFQTRTTFLDDIRKTEEERKKDMLDLTNLNNVVIDTGLRPVSDFKTYPDIVTTQSLLNVNPWENPSIEIISKPTVEEELSKIHEELAELRKERNETLDENIELGKEIEKLKIKLKKERTKTKSQKEEFEVQQIEQNDMQDQVDKLELRMNDVETDYSVKSEFK